MPVRQTLVLPLSLATMGVVLAMACSDGKPNTPLQPSAISTPPANAAPSLLIAPVSAGNRLGTAAIDFPPNNEPFAFRQRLETYYRDTLRAGLGQSYVDLEGGGVWIAEYIRYRVNLCSHGVAVANVMTRIDTLGRVDPPVCGNPPGGTVVFPPRNEPADFRQQLEAKYRDQLRRNPIETYVNLEGDIVWMQQYYLYRLNGCDHNQGTDKTLMNIATGQVQPYCGPTMPPTVAIQAVINGPTGAVNAGDPVRLSGLNSSSNMGPIVSYQWNCAQVLPQGVNARPPNCSSSSATPEFRYPKQGNLGTTLSYVVRLTVTDSRGNTAARDFTVRITQVYG